MKRTLLSAAALLAAALLHSPANAQTGPYQFYPLTPCRIVDTRSGYGGVIASNVARTFTVKLANGCGVPSDAKAAALNVTIAGPSGNGYLTLWPTGSAQPNASTINFTPNDLALANGAIAPLSAAATSDLSVLYGAGPSQTVHLILDVTGYFK